MKKLVLVLIVLCCSTFVHAQSYSQGYSLGEGDAEETFYLFHRESRCFSLVDEPGESGSPITYKDCWVCTNEQGFVNFWQGYIVNVENNYCNQIGTSSEQYAKGVCDGYKNKMSTMSMQYGTNYYGGGARPIICN